MGQRTFEMELRCPTCGRTGVVTYEERPGTMPAARPIRSTGNYRIEADGWPVCECQGPPA